MHAPSVADVSVSDEVRAKLFLLQCMNLKCLSRREHWSPYQALDKPGISAPDQPLAAQTIQEHYRYLRGLMDLFRVRTSAR